jgi:hypothetical protein
MTPLIIGEANILSGWLTMVLGLVSGSILGLWAFGGPFPAPPGHKEYSDLPRRMVRLGHIALVALPIINILYGQYVDSLPLRYNTLYLGSRSMIVCMVGVPLFLFLGSLWQPFKYVEIIPVGAGILGLAIMAYGNFLLL